MKNKKKNTSLIILAIIGVIISSAIFLKLLVEQNGFAYILALIIIVILIRLGIKTELKLKNNKKMKLQNKMQYVYESDEEAKDYQICFNDLCMLNKNEFNSVPLGDFDYYKNKIIKEFTRQTNDNKLNVDYFQQTHYNILNLFYSKNDTLNLNNAYSNFDYRFYGSSSSIFSSSPHSPHCETREYFKGSVLDFPLQIATIKCFSTGRDPYSVTFCIIDKNINANIKIEKIALHQTPENDDILLNLSNEEFKKLKIVWAFPRKNEVNISTTNDKFNRFFNVYTDNEEKARSFLTDELLKTIAEIRIKYKIDFEIIFKDKVYIRFFTENMFDIKDMLLTEEGDKVSAIQYCAITKLIKELAKFL